MIKGSILAVTAFFGFALAVIAQESSGTSSPLAFYHPEALGAGDGSALMHELPMFALLDGQHLPLSTPMGRMGNMPVNLSTNTSFNFAQVRAVGGPAVDAKDSSKEVQPSHVDPLFYSGEVGVFYGHASGKFGGDDYGSYFEGTVGNDKLQITVGGSYDQFDGHVPRWAR